MSGSSRRNLRPLLPLLCAGLLSSCADQLPLATLTVAVEGPGSIVSDPPGIDCGATCTGSFAQGTVVRLQAVPQPGARSAGVEAKLAISDGAACTSDTPQCWLTLSSDAQAKGRFVPIADSCTDGKKNGSETDVDCGGTCGPCGADAVCQRSSDCGNGQCIAGVCTSCPLDTNLLYNGDGESDPSAATAPGWTFSGGFTLDRYGGGNLAATDPGPPSRGLNFFYGGVSAQSTATTTIDLCRCTRLIEKQPLKLKVSGYLGGFAAQNDNIAVRFGVRLGASVVNQLTLGPVLAADRANVTGLLLREASTTLPKGTCGVDVVITSTRAEGASNDGYADSLTATVSLQ